MEYHLWEESRQGIVCRTPLLTLPCTKCWTIQMRKDKRRDLRPRSSHPGSETHPKTDNPIYRGKSRVPPRWAVETEREWPAPPIKFRKPLPRSDIWAESWRMSKNSPFFLGEWEELCKQMKQRGRGLWVIWYENILRQELWWKLFICVWCRGEKTLRIPRVITKMFPNQRLC